MALTPQDVTNRPLTAAELATVERLEQAIDAYILTHYQGGDCITFTLEHGAPSHRIQQEIIRRYTVPEDPGRGWSVVKFDYSQHDGDWIYLGK